MPYFDPNDFDPNDFETLAPEPTTTGLTPLPGIDMQSVLPLIKGDVYNEAQGRAVYITQSEFVAEAWPDLSSATVVLRLSDAGTVTTISGTVVTATGGSKQVRFNLTSTHTANATGEGARFDVRATIGGNVVTLRQGPLRIYSNL